MRKSSRATSTPDNIIDIYLSEYEKGIAETPYRWCKENGYSYPKLKWWAEKSNITLPKKAINYCEVDKQIDWAQHQSIITGHLLGDGSLIYPKKNRSSVCFQASCAHKEYLEWLQTICPFYKDKAIWEVDTYDVRTDKTYHRYWMKSSASQNLEATRKLWYPNGTKLLPEEFTLDNLGLLIFYLEDGCTNHSGLTLSCNDFSERDILRLQDYLIGLLEVKVNLVKEKEEYKKLYIPRKSIDSFFNYVGACPVSCYDYKWKLCRFEEQSSLKQVNIG